MIYKDNKKLTVINFFAGPGAGKSTTAAGLFHKMKQSHKNVELVSEWIKDEGMWEQRNNLFTEQDFIFANQHRKIRRLVSHDIDYCVTDSPLLLTVLYTPEGYPASFETFVHDISNTYTNINFLLLRSEDVQYQTTGRAHDYQQSCQKDEEIKQYLDKHNISYYEVVVSPTVVQDCMKILETVDPRFETK